MCDLDEEKVQVSCGGSTKALLECGRCQALQITHRAANLLREIFLTGDRHATDGIRFQMLPDQLVGVAVWRIRRQKEQAQFRTQRLYESADFLRTMSRATIDDQKDFALGARTPVAWAMGVSPFAPHVRPA